MLTIEALKEFGANTEEGLARCLNNEQFYFKLIKKAVADDSVEKLKNAIDKGDLKQAFEIAHSLKGVYGNLSLTPMYETARTLTELLRSLTDTDYTEYIKRLGSLKATLTELSAE